MANFLGNLGAAFRGQQDYQQYLDAQEATKLRLKADKAKLSELEDLTEEAKKQRGVQSKADALEWAYRQNQGMGMPPPPAGGMPDGAQAPAPGQASVPMIQPDQKPVQYNPNPQAPGGPPGMGMPPPPPQGPPQGQMPPQGPQMPPQGPPQGQQGPAQPQGPQRPPVPPYQTVGGAGPQQAQQPLGIAPPPAQAQKPPMPGSMSLEDAVNFAKAQGITDPQVGLQFLRNLAPSLNNEAKQQLAALKVENDMQKRELLHNEKVAALEETKKKEDRIAKSEVATLEERKRASMASEGIRQQLADAAKENAASKRRAQVENGESGGLTKQEVQYWAQVMGNGGALPPRMAKGDIRAISKAAANSDITPQEMLANKAAQAGRTSEQRTIGTTSANVSMAGFEAENAAKILHNQADQVYRTTFVPVNKALNAFNEGVGEPNVRAFGAAINTFVNTYARAISPKGVATVSDKDHARDLLSKADSPAAFTKIMSVLEQEMAMAQKVPQLARDKSRNESLGKTTTTQTFSNKDELQAAIKAGKIKKGDTFNDPSGNPHTVN